MTFATLSRRFAALMLSAGMLLGVTASPALAGHDDVVKSNASVCHIDGHGAVVLTKSIHALSKFERGFYGGMSDGAIVGFEDGYHGLPFCDVPRVSLERRHHRFARGYVQGFTEAYAAGFRRGRSNHARSHTVTRRRIDPYRNRDWNSRWNRNRNRHRRVVLDPWHRLDRIFRVTW